jgi:hypothetical protein
MKACKLLLSAIGAALLLGALAGVASARNLSTTSQTFRVAFRTLTVRGMFGVTNCEITLEGSLHARTIAKVNDTLIGYITRATRGTCGAEGGTTILTETLPWRVLYGTFNGVLPNISAITTHIVDFSYQIRERTRTCLARSLPENRIVMPFLRDTTSRALTIAELIGNIITDCNEFAVFSSTRDSVTVLNSSARITVTLI